MYSNTIKINAGKLKSELITYPNPVQNGQLNVQVSGIAKGNYNINIYAITGALVYTSILNSEGTATSKIITLPNAVKNGNYTLEVTNGTFKSIKTILVN